MSEKPYYEQEYHAPESDIPDPSVGEIFKGLFLYPFTWAARSTRKAFWAVSHITFLTWLIELILFILLVWIKLGLLGYAVRRLHDANYSGWWLWLIIIPFGWIIAVIFLLLPTVEEPVRWVSYLFVD